jgi:hypothetical protein
MPILITLLPLITKSGLFLIDFFYKDEAQREQKKKDFLQAIQDHLDEAHRAVSLRASDQAQSDWLREKVQDAKKNLDNLDGKL